jgi:glucose/mannose-6-phosphate isomerase
MVYTWPDLIENIMARSIDVPSHISIGNHDLSYQDSIGQILITGMGGSAISGDYLKKYLEKKLNIPILVQRNYNIPVYASTNTLVITMSYSGNTEETISCLIQSIKNRCPTFCISSGGKLEAFCIASKLPFFSIPPGYQPRASFPLLFFPLLKILDAMNLIKLDQAQVEECVNQLKHLREIFRPQSLTSENQAKQIALKLFKRTPIIWSSMFCISNRIKCQINENAKELAIAEELPEFNHNHIVGFEGLTVNDPFVVIVLRFPDDISNITLRYDITKAIVEKKIEVVEVTIQEGGLLSQLVSATYLGDYFSMYLALLYDRNPSTVESIDFLKKQMEKRGKTQSSLMKTLDSLIL